MTMMEQIKGLFISYTISMIYVRKISYTTIKTKFDNEIEKEVLKKLLKEEFGNVSRVAKLMGLDRSNIQRRMIKWKISPKKFRRKKR